MSKKTSLISTNRKDFYKNASGPVTIRLTNDFLFKTLLQENTYVLKSLICSLLHFSPAHVRNATITNPIIMGDNIKEKSFLLDVNVVFNNGSRINLEMQVVNEHDWTKRSTIYACRNLSKINKGSKYKAAKSVYQIGFLDYTLFPDHPGFYSTYKLTDIKTHHIFTEMLSIRVVDLTNISLATPEDKRYNIDKWAMLFKSNTWEDIKMLAAQDTGISSAAETIYQLSEDERIQQECEAREEFLLRQESLYDYINTANKTIAKHEQTIKNLKNMNIEQRDTIESLQNVNTEQRDTIESLKKELAGLKAIHNKQKEAPA